MAAHPNALPNVPDATGTFVASAVDEDQINDKGKLANVEVFEGKLRDGNYNGRGTAIMPNGVYEGEIRDGKYNGRAKVTMPDGEVYEGEFRDGAMASTMEQERSLCQMAKFMRVNSGMAGCATFKKTGNS